jgi:hypothetical protein
VTVGATVSTVKVFAELVPVLPAVSACEAWAVYVPLASAELAGTEYEVPVRVVGRVCSNVPPVPMPA